MAKFGLYDKPGADMAEYELKLILKVFEQRLEAWRTSWEQLGTRDTDVRDRLVDEMANVVK